MPETATEDTRAVPASYITPAQRIDWLTPGYVGEWVYDIYGTRQVDLDPTSHPQALIEAKTKWYGQTPDEDGMRKEWTDHGLTCFINPTYGDKKPKQDPPPFFYPMSEWIQKMSLSAQPKGNHPGMKIIALLPAYTDRKWFHRYVTQADAFCLLQKRVRFLAPNPDGKPISRDQPGQGHMLVCWSAGDKAMIDAFFKTMDPHGLCIEPKG